MGRAAPSLLLTASSIDSNLAKIDLNLSDICLFQSPRNGDDLSEGEGEGDLASPEDSGHEMGQKVDMGGRRR